MRNLINIVLNPSASRLDEDLNLVSAKDHKIVLDDPCNDEVETLDQASDEEREEILKDVERDINEGFAFILALEACLSH